EQNEFLRSVQVMEKLLHEYPPEPYLATATYALAQEVYAKAPAAAQDSKLRKEKINRVTLIQRALEMLDQFLTALPEDPAADQASFSLANALLDLEKYEQAIASSQRYATRYPKSDFLDSYWYIIGYCHFARGQHQQALEMCNKVAEAKRTDRHSGREVESPNKWRAIYIVGQIYHSLGKAEDAIKHYTRVQDRFADARQAILYFARKQINLPEVTVIKPQENATIELKFRNLATCNATVYRIDLMKFSLLRRNLAGITNINLAGIRPFHEASIPLGDGKDYRDRSIQLTLPVKEEGAYLGVCRGENLHTSGLVLVTPLALEVQEDATSGRVRTTVRNTVDKRYVTDVHVKVIGTRNPDFSSGETDLRGVFVADAIKGKSMVIAQAKGNRYAFFRGTADLGPLPASPKKSEEGKKVTQDAKRGKNPTKEDLLEGLQQDNRGIQMEQQKQLEGFYRNGIQKGIGGGFGGGIF
ncbi:MAG: tetratricopeptide repeat protein, partial [Pirellulaceae bacterium]